MPPGPRAGAEGLTSIHARGTLSVKLRKMNRQANQLVMVPEKAMSNSAAPGLSPPQGVGLARSRRVNSAGLRGRPPPCPGHPQPPRRPMVAMHAKPLRLLGLALRRPLLAGPPTAAEERQNVYHVGVEGQDYLHHFSSEGGANPRLRPRAAGRLRPGRGIRLSTCPCPSSACCRSSWSARAGLKYPDHPIYGLPIKEQLRAGVHYSRPVVKYLGGTMVRPERLGQGMNGFRRLGTVLGFATFNFDDFVRAGIVQVVEESEIPALLRMAIAGRVDGVDLDRGGGPLTWPKTSGCREPWSSTPSCPTCAGHITFHPAPPGAPARLRRLPDPGSPLVAKLKAKWGVEP